MKRYSKLFNTMYNTFCTTERALALLHLPCLKLPQDPWGIPKLANLIEEMICCGDGHSSDSTGFEFLLDPVPEIHISTGGGWDSEICEHKLSTCVVAKDSSVGSPPISSNNTRVFPLGFNHSPGTWYLWENWYQNLNFLNNFSNNHFSLAYSCWEGFPQFLRHLLSL